MGDNEKAKKSLLGSIQTGTEPSVEVSLQKATCRFNNFENI